MEWESNLPNVRSYNLPNTKKKLSKKKLKSLNRQRSFPISATDDSLLTPRQRLRRKAKINKNKALNLLKKSVENLNNKKNLNNKHESENSSKISIGELAEADDDCIMIDKPTEIITIDDDEINTDSFDSKSVHESHCINNNNKNKWNLDLENRKLSTFSKFLDKVKFRPLLGQNKNPWFEKNNVDDAINLTDAKKQNKVQPNSTCINISDTSKRTVPELSTKISDRLIFPKNNGDTSEQINSIDSSSSLIFWEDKNISSNNNKIRTPLYERLSCNTIDSIESNIVEENTSKKNIEDDDSVIFVGESIEIDQNNSKSGNQFIPISSESHKNQHIESYRKIINSPDLFVNPFKRFKTSNTSTPKCSTSINNRLLTIKESRQKEKYNTNLYNPLKNNEHEGISKSNKRMIFIDGSNVAFSHSLNRGFSVKGLEICLEYFERLGHEVKAVVPQFRLQRNKCSDPERLQQLHSDGKIVLTPCKNLPGKSSTSYDDRFILQLAVEFDAAIISNDNYRDLLNENAAFAKIIEHQVIGYTWCNDLFMLPKDPYGRNGPNLSVILNKT